MPDVWGSRVASSPPSAYGWPSRRARVAAARLVVEPAQLGQPIGAADGLDVAGHAAGADGCELLIITDQPDPAACRMKSTAVSRETVSTFAASSMITKVNGATPKASRQV